MTKTKQELNAHLFRLAIWSVVSLVAGVSLMLASSDTFLRSFGGMNLAWALINLLICFFSWRGKTEPKLTTFREVLALNLGLNCGYMGIGGTLLALGDAGTKGAGLAVLIQGLALLVLDAILYRRLPKPESV